MPTYIYQSDDGDIKELTGSYSEYKEKINIEIDGKLYKRVIKPFSFVLKGNGWHATDYGKYGKTE
jgi:predicted nucleic acid-binding Zn ribbon protein